MKVARRFAELAEESLGLDCLRKIDERNRAEQNVRVCHSHDFIDANDLMRSAVLDVLGLDVVDCLNDKATTSLWERAWAVAREIGLRRLSAVRGAANQPIDVPQIAVHASGRMTALLPGLVATERPLEVRFDYYGRNPHLQALCYEHDGEDEDALVCVRYDLRGKIAEVVLGETVMIRTREGFQVYRGEETPWEIERWANPPCIAGDRLEMPSRLIGTVMALRERYRSLEELKAYAATYGVLDQLNNYPGAGRKAQVFTTPEQAWEVNPLTVGTTDVADFSTVPTQALGEGVISLLAGASDYRDVFVVWNERDGTLAIVKEEGKPAKWLTFDSERDAQLELLGELYKQFQQFSLGQSVFDEINLRGMSVQPAKLFHDGSLDVNGEILSPPR